MEATSSAGRSSCSSDATPSKKRRATSTGGQGGPLPLGVAVSVKTEPEGKRGGLPLLLRTSGVDNPILAALGGTPRSQAVAANGFPEPEPLDLSQCSAATSMDSAKEEEKMEREAAAAVKEEKVTEEDTVKVLHLKQEEVTTTRRAVAKQEQKPHAVSFVKTESSAVLETKYRVDAAPFGTGGCAFEFFMKWI